MPTEGDDLTDNCFSAGRLSLVTKTKFPKIYFQKSQILV